MSTLKIKSFYKYQRKYNLTPLLLFQFDIIQSW